MRTMTVKMLHTHALFEGKISPSVSGEQTEEAADVFILHLVIFQTYINPVAKIINTPSFFLLSNCKLQTAGMGITSR